MNYSTAVFLINPSVRAVGVSYEPAPGNPDAPASVTIFKTLNQSIKPRDLVIVPTDTRWRMTIARVETIDLDVDFDSPHEIKWIIGCVDKQSFEEVLAMEQQAITTIRSAEIRKKREDLASALMADNEALKALPIASAGHAPALASDEPEDLQPL